VFSSVRHRCGKAVVSEGIRRLHSTDRLVDIAYQMILAATETNRVGGRTPGGPANTKPWE